MDYADSLLNMYKQCKTLPQGEILKLLKQGQELLSQSPNIVIVPRRKGVKVSAIGDLHGQFYDLLHIFETFGYPSSEHIYIFNGDYVDRGSFGCEIFTYLLAVKIAQPDHLILLRGNHESERCTTIYGFKNEVFDKYSQSVYSAFIDTFHTLPLAAVVHDTIFVVHGGLFDRPNVTLDDINKVNRFCEIGDEGGELLMAQMTWADPMDAPGSQSLIRSFGTKFGPDITERFLKENKLELVVRSHQVREEGHSVQHHGQLITLFSAPSYCGESNQGCVFDMIPTETSTEFRFTKFHTSSFPEAKFYIPLPNNSTTNMK
ncbi:putative Serine/threonine-protein phosphatase [Blattamonas nauphoetae]|uniref:Serine/threonine-protein phosphatase n=1 Tax=Blattamonas nauphoetae TaxID=2049346 RepID=A0ABQ9Y3I9_9EUKA|nr:putative Serine/threonine-protein phosphatase [Blattamonas nauphoetae]